MTIRYLSLAGLAQRIGVSKATAATYLRDKRLPEPDAVIGEVPGHKFGWLPETVDEWQASRPGHGGRKPRSQA